MTKNEISKLFDIPVSTLNDWQKEDSNRHKLYKFLKLSNIKEAKQLFLQKNNHRIFHILNRNIDKSEAFSEEDIKIAFSKNDYNSSTLKEHVIYSKFFKECDEEDLESLITQFNLSIRNIKKIYQSSPLRQLKGVTEIWDKRFRLKGLNISSQAANNISIPPALQQLLAKRALNV